MKILQIFSIFNGKDKHVFDSQISWDFANEIDEFSENDFPKVRKKLEKVGKKKLELEQNPF